MKAVLDVDISEIRPMPSSIIHQLSPKLSTFPTAYQARILFKARGGNWRQIVMTWAGRFCP
jgi:hypothetical protein